MNWKMHDKEFENVLALPPPRRYEYFVKKVADRELLWSLASDEGWVIMGDDEGHELVPVWPHERFAASCATGKFVDHEPRPIDLSNWIEKWTPGMQRDQLLVAVFPTPDGKGVPVTPERLKEDLEAELSLIE